MTFLRRFRRVRLAAGARIGPGRISPGGGPAGTAAARGRTAANAEGHEAERSGARGLRDVDTVALEQVDEGADDRLGALRFRQVRARAQLKRRLLRLRPAA